MSNQVVIYSNGIADFRWKHEIERESTKQISIPVRTEYLADILSSLTVYGNVKIESPPSYQPRDNQRRILDLNTENVLENLAQLLCGAQVKVETAAGSFDGKIIGTQPEQRPTEGRPYTVNQLMITSDRGIQKIAFGEIVSLQFVDPAIQNEIDLALTKNIDQMKPNSTVVNMTLAAQEDTNALVQYTVPSAAWKISYRIVTSESSSMQFMGFAIVDNNTDYDWTDFLVSVVTGEPITFSSDLDEIRIPDRQHVNLVRDTALGAVEAEADSFEVAEAYLAEEMPVAKRARGKFRKAGALNKVMLGSFSDENIKSADFDSASTQEVGDFCIFHAAHPVSIGANSSTMIPIFDIELDQSKSVLYFNELKHQRRPYRAIRFFNSTEFPLGRGACTVFEEHSYAGSCVLPATKPNAESLLVHALDTGVKVTTNHKPSKTRRVSIKVSNGVAIENVHNTNVTEYQVNNQHEKDFKLLLDQPCSNKNAKFSVTVERRDKTETIEGEMLDNNFRVAIDLHAKEQCKISITVSRHHRNRVKLVGQRSDSGVLDIGWIQDNFVEVNEELLSEPAIQAAIQLQSELDKKKVEIGQHEKEIERLGRRQERLRKNISAGGQDQQSSKWRTDLAKSEDALVAIEEEVIPGLRAEEKQLREKLFDALKKLVIDWEADSSVVAKQ